MGLSVQVSHSGRAIHICSHTSMECCRCWFSANLMSPKEDFPELSTSSSFLCVWFFSFWHSSHLHWWKVLLTHINGREKKWSFVVIFQTCFKKRSCGFLGFQSTLYSEWLVCDEADTCMVFVASFIWSLSFKRQNLRFVMSLQYSKIAKQVQWIGWAFPLPCLRRTKPIVANAGWSHVREKEGVSVWVWTKAVSSSLNSKWFVSPPSVTIAQHLGRDCTAASAYDHELSLLNSF